MYTPKIEKKHVDSSVYASVLENFHTSADAG